VTKEHSYADILKGSMAQNQNQNQKNPTHEKPVPATVLPNNLDTETTNKDIPFQIPHFIYSVTTLFFSLQPH
jgi:hypothetical protein